MMAQAASHPRGTLPCSVHAHLLTDASQPGEGAAQSLSPRTAGLFGSRVWAAPALFVLILLLAAGLRFHLLGAQSLWNDEGSSYVQATRSLASIADHTARDIHPPGYYWLLHIWLRLTGESEFALRALSALASVLAVAFTGAIGSRVFGPGVGLLAALFTTLNTFSIYYAQEARMYALLALWSAAAFWALVHLIQAQEAGRSPWRAALALAIFNAAGLYTQYAFPFVMVAQGLVWLIWALPGVRGRLRQRARALGVYVAANLLTLLLYAPWLSTAWEQVTTWPNTGQAIPLSEAIGEILAYLAFGLTVGTGTSIAVAFFLLFALVQLPAERPKRPLWSLLLPMTWVLSVVGIFLALALFREANLKFLLPAQMGFALWVARGVSVLGQVQPRRADAWARGVPPAAAALAVFSILLTLWQGLDALYHDPAYQRDNYRAIVQRISADPRPDDAVILNAPGQGEVFGYYYRGDAAIYPIPWGYGGDDNATLTETLAIIDQHERIYAVLWGTEERDPNSVVERTLDAEAFEADSTWYGDVRLVRYAAPADFDGIAPAAEDVAFAAPGGATVRLLSATLGRRSVSPGDVLQVQLVWSTDAPLTTRYKVFVQLLNAEGVLVAQRDAEPVGGTQPTPAWAVDAAVIDNHALAIPDDLPPANYSLIIGLYNRDEPFARLNLLPPSAGDALALGQVTVE